MTNDLTQISWIDAELWVRSHHLRWSLWSVHWSGATAVLSSSAAGVVSNCDILTFVYVNYHHVPASWLTMAPYLTVSHHDSP